MKTVYLVRHAKSSWDFSGLEDHERPLNDRGLRDAPMMANLLKGKKVQPDAIFASPAVRALTTAIFFKNELRVEGEDFFVKDVIYEAMPEQIISLVRMLPEDVETILLFGHNPTFTSVANRFTKDHIANIPTCGIVRIDAEIDNWMQFSPDTASVTAFYYPKQFV